MLRINLKHRLMLSGGLAGLSLASYYLLTASGPGDGLMIIASLVAAWPIARKAIEALRYKIIGIDLLVTIAVIGAIIIGEYWEAAAVAILFLLGEYLEARALEKTRSAIKLLLDMSPRLARVVRHGQELEISPQEVALGEVVIVKPGEKISVDGTVNSGQAYVDQSSITGESLPVSISKDSQAYSGTIVESGYLELVASKVGKDTMFARILHMVEEAQDNKAKTQAFLERFAKYYTPAVILLAIITLIISADVYLALTLLVIACPGALVIAVPVSIVAGIGSAARNGVLIKGGEAIEQASRAKVVAFDKTGTLTQGKPRVVDSLALDGNQAQLINLAASAEHYSEHPLAQAIVAASPRGAKLAKPTTSDIFIGQGIAATVGKKRLLVGNQKLLASHKVSLPAKLRNYLATHQAEGQTVSLVAVDGLAVGAIAIADTVRKDAGHIVSQLQATGKKVVMLTGDNLATARAIAAQLGIDQVYADLSPEDKVTQIKQLQASDSKGVIMVGDGVNDAPALATADLGVAIGGPGKDVAMETADIVLLSGNINRLGYALRLTGATTRNMKQNIYFAVIVVVLLLIGVLANIVILSSGMLIHVVSVLLVIVNAFRLLRYNQ